MDTEEAIIKVFEELRSAEEMFPGWPDDCVHGAAILGEEAGEVIKAALDYYYDRGDKADLEKEIIQTGAMVFRFLLNLTKEE